jgi:hypothetical protein
VTSASESELDEELSMSTAPVLRLPRVGVATPFPFLWRIEDVGVGDGFSMTRSSTSLSC